MFRTGSPYGFLQQQADASADPQIVFGHSGYFSAPQDTLDPHLFDGERLKPNVRDWILSTFYRYWNKKYRNAVLWSTVWLAGSGISYQWAGDRGNGDLDVLVGVDWPGFYQHNVDHRGISKDDAARLINEDLKTNLWPKTATKNLNGQTYEVTFYVNPGGTDIRDIHPYAAYDVTHNDWTIKPPVLPHDPSSLYPKEWWSAAKREEEEAQHLVAEYRALHEHADRTQPGSAGWVNTMAGLTSTAARARALFDDIHLGRRAAFGPGGQGYGDWANFRWQYHKRAGTVEALHTIASVDAEARKAEQVADYGEPLKSGADALSEASLWYARHTR